MRLSEIDGRVEVKEERLIGNTTHKVKSNKNKNIVMLSRRK